MAATKSGGAAFETVTLPILQYTDLQFGGSCETADWRLEMAKMKTNIIDAIDAAFKKQHGMLSTLIADKLKFVQPPTKSSVLLAMDDPLANNNGGLSSASNDPELFEELATPIKTLL